MRSQRRRKPPERRISRRRRKRYPRKWRVRERRRKKSKATTPQEEREEAWVIEKENCPLACGEGADRGIKGTLHRRHSGVLLLRLHS